MRSGNHPPSAGIAVLVIVAAVLSPVIAAASVAGQANHDQVSDDQLTTGRSTADRLGVERAAGTGVGPDGVDARSHQAGNGPTREGGTDAGNASRFEVVEVTSDVAVGESGNLTVAIENVGEDVVRDAMVTVSSASQDVRFTTGGEQAPVSAGAIEPGEIERVPVDVVVSPSAEERRYTIDVTVTYRPGADEPRQNETLLAGFTPGSTQELDVRAEDSSLYVDDTGTLRGELVNDGNRDIDDAVLVLEGADNESDLITVADDRQVLGEIVPGQSASFAFEVDVGPDVESGPRQFKFHVEYEDEDDRRQRSEVLIEEWTVRDRRETFELRDVESTLRVDDDGDVTGQLRYRGEETARDAVLVLVEPGTNATGSLSPTETEYALGDLEPNETANVSFEIDASAETVAGPRQLTFRVRYVDEDGQTQRSDPIYARVEVGEEREVFAVELVESSVAAGSTDVVRLRVTNVGDEPVTDVSAKLFADDPVSADDDEAFVPRLEPGESATLIFRVSVAGDALAKVYPLSVDFEYEDADGDTELSDTYRVGLSVREPEDDGFFGLAFAVGGLALVAALLVAGVRR